MTEYDSARHDEAAPAHAAAGPAEMPAADGGQVTSLWEILICSINARTAELADILSNLEQQIEPYEGRVRVIVDRDDCERAVGEKRTRLVLASTAEYISFVDDDDDLSDRYVEAVIDALEERPDYVGFEVEYTVDGRRQKPVFHSLRHENWSEDERGYYRGVTHLNPIRREFAVLGLPFVPDNGDDAEWARRVQQTGLVRREVFVPEPLYRYRYSPTGSLTTHSASLAARLRRAYRRRLGKGLPKTGPVQAPATGRYVRYL
jgi:hypothetical protein